MITIFSGNPGSGKTLALAIQCNFLLNRNARWFKKTGIVRKLNSNIKFSKKIEEKYKNFIEYWDQPKELILKKETDIIWDEISTHLDSHNWKEIGDDMKRWLRMHRKRGIDIFGTAQNFLDVDIAVKRLTDRLFLMDKFFWCGEPAATKPPVDFVW